MTGITVHVAQVKCTLVQALRLCTSRTAHRGVAVWLYPFMTTALEGGEGSASRPGRSLPPGKTRYSLYRRLGGRQGRSGQVRKISPPPPGFDARTVQFVTSRCTDYVTRPTVAQGSHEFDKHCWMSVHPSSPVITQPSALVKGKRRETWN